MGDLSFNVLHNFYKKLYDLLIFDKLRYQEDSIIWTSIDFRIKKTPRFFKIEVFGKV
jgi:hypothetical protein